MVGFRMASLLVGNVVGVVFGHVGSYLTAWASPGFMELPLVLMSHAWEPGCFSVNVAGVSWIISNACSLHVCAELCAALRRAVDTQPMHVAADLLLILHCTWCGFGACLLCTPMHWFGDTHLGWWCKRCHLVCAFFCCWGQVAYAWVAAFRIDPQLSTFAPHLTSERELATRSIMAQCTLVSAMLTTVLGALNEFGPSRLRACKRPKRLGLTWFVLIGELVTCFMPPWTPMTYWQLLTQLDAASPTFTSGLGELIETLIGFSAVCDSVESQL
mmetsp:Transcript_44776/g.74281  ORF Transcript_44776/g.74281 Transcript_44776/m.74281 type:complete len:272 (+) Transcript_44776:185-1000(+)